ncbi:MAG: hypothetical protein AVO33_08395 [delta proteobacterium ML8_F1]|nr:MAG: hypothetical protein AVO33_08395 [delta proteobacterium ML8_F1]
MDIKEKIEAIVDKIQSSKTFKSQFEADPVKAVESVLGMDLPDDQIEELIEAVKGKISLDKAGDLMGKVKGLF